MSEKELCIQLLEKVPPYKMRYLLAYMQGLTADEDADDTFCEELYQNYLRDPERGEFVSLADAMNACGVEPDEV